MSDDPDENHKEPMEPKKVGTAAADVAQHCAVAKTDSLHGYLQVNSRQMQRKLGINLTLHNSTGSNLNPARVPFTEAIGLKTLLCTNSRIWKYGDAVSIKMWRNRLNWVRYPLHRRKRKTIWIRVLTPVRQLCKPASVSPPGGAADPLALRDTESWDVDDGIGRKSRKTKNGIPRSAYIPNETNFGEKAYKDARLTGDFSRQSRQVILLGSSREERVRPEFLRIAANWVIVPCSGQVLMNTGGHHHRIITAQSDIADRFTDPVTPGACQRVARLLVPGPFRPQVTIHGPSTVQSHHFWRYQGFHLMDWHAQILTHTAVEVVAHEISETPPKSSTPIAWKLDSRFTVPLVKMTFLMADVQRVMYDTPHCALADFVPTQRSGRQPSGFGTRVWRRSGTSEIWKGANVSSNPAMSIDRLIRSEFEWDGPNKRVGLIRPDGADLDLGN
ncbi:hypothetical protein B0H11DRAFT_1914857 [Mycena galericulata]|nr:hypothetical protein B0H11DRAFT_1914857 [Mycena galericulata]